ncbi:MAG: hypothetical protein B6U85_06005 [Desulfurococcales archaeon ex4484_42]|nr:MAG: hypothetical protein B6U85_06005 [Desulfurococcales archaeon ex4484_42]
MSWVTKVFKLRLLTLKLIVIFSMYYVLSLTNIPLTALALFIASSLIIIFVSRLRYCVITAIIASVVLGLMSGNYHMALLTISLLTLNDLLDATLTTYLVPAYVIPISILMYATPIELRILVTSIYVLYIIARINGESLMSNSIKAVSISLLLVTLAVMATWLTPLTTVVTFYGMVLIVTCLLLGKMAKVIKEE